jgi:hypothetical protein
MSEKLICLSQPLCQFRTPSKYPYIISVSHWMHECSVELYSTFLKNWMHEQELYSTFLKNWMHEQELYSKFLKNWMHEQELYSTFLKNWMHEQELYSKF